MTSRSNPPDLNLLPQQYRPRQVTAPQVLGMLLIIGLCIGLIPVTLTSWQSRQRSQEQQVALDQSLAQLQAQDGAPDEMQALNQQIDDLQTRLQLLQAETGFVQGWQTAHAPAIIAAVAASPASEIILTEINQQEMELTLTGKTESQAQVLEYARALQVTAKFTNVRIEMLSSVAPPGSPPVVQFIIQTTE
ncbi:MAG: PilN domain-containing protein [Chloroflexota bacterium]|nr:PilN domain-containing protein [Chloroflexota bacterium]